MGFHACENTNEEEKELCRCDDSEDDEDMIVILRHPSMQYPSTLILFFWQEKLVTYRIYQKGFHHTLPKNANNALYLRHF